MRRYTLMIAVAAVATLGITVLAVQAATPCSGHKGCSSQASKDIVDTAVHAGSFETLATALKEAELIPALKGDGPFTVFAPTDAAFAKLPEGTIEALLKDKEKLTAILTYHVVPGRVTAADVVKVDSAKTLQGEPINVKACPASGSVQINDAKVVKADVMASNGVIHVIDSVLLPPQ